MAPSRIVHRVSALLSVLVAATSAVSVKFGTFGDRGAVLTARTRNASSSASPAEAGATLSDNMGGAYKFTMRLLNEGTEAWSIGSTAVLEDVPDELRGATLFAGTRDLVWRGKLTINAQHAGYAYVFATPAKDGGITKHFWEQIGSMGWNGTDNGQMVIYRRAMKQSSWLDIEINSRWTGGVAFRRDESAEEKATNLQLDYLYYGCRAKKGLVNAVSRDDPLSMTVERCFLFCSGHAGSVYFGLEKGRSCWCADLFYGGRLEQSRCGAPCDGNAMQKCGGDGGASSVHMMFSCNSPRPPAVPPIEYSKRDDHTCGALGQGPGQWLQRRQRTAAEPRPPTEDEPGGYRVTIDGSETLVGQVEDCEKACSTGVGNHQCGAFTYNSNLMKCTFLLVGDADWAEFGMHLACYSKVWPDAEEPPVV